MRGVLSSTTMSAAGCVCSALLRSHTNVLLCSVHSEPIPSVMFRIRRTGQYRKTHDLLACMAGSIGIWPVKGRNAKAVDPVPAGGQIRSSSPNSTGGFVTRNFRSWRNGGSTISTQSSASLPRASDTPFRD